MSETKTYTVSIYTENNIGLLNRISAIFQRRKINIESLNTSISEIEGVAIYHRDQPYRRTHEKDYRSA